jgi:hypothetical protein
VGTDPTDPTRRGKLSRIVGRVGPRIAGAVSAQLSQALASFALQVLAARELGARGLGTFALLYGSIVLGTAICTGLVGDSLTVLDRSLPRLRAGLQAWCALVSAGAGAAAATITWASGVLDASAALMFGLATVVFLIEDALRRTLMAVMRFWSLPLVDGMSLVASVAVLVVIRNGKGHLTVGDFMLALLIGQLAAPHGDAPGRHARGLRVRCVALGAAGSPPGHAHRGSAARDPDRRLAGIRPP